MRPIHILRTIADLSVELKARRLERGIRQERLASVIGLARCTTANIENAAGDPKISTLIKVAEALGYRVTFVSLEVSQYLEGFELPVGIRAGVAIKGIDEDFDLTDVWKGD